MTWLLEINGRITSHGNGPMDSVQVGKAVFVKESYTTLGIEPSTFSYPGRYSEPLIVSVGLKRSVFKLLKLGCEFIYRWCRHLEGRWKPRVVF